MSRLCAIAIFLFALACPGQDLSGRWEGPLAEEGTIHRIVLDVERNPNGGWSATIYSIDETPQPFSVEALSAEGSTVKLAVNDWRASYVGTLQPNGSTIVGQFSQQAHLPLTLHHTGPVPGTVLDKDHEFDTGSHLGSVSNLTPQQVEDLALLARMWGFLKYHHPTVTSGQRHWDYELLRVMPAVLKARDRKSFEQVASRWVDSLGPLPVCSPCVQLEQKQLALPPDIEWIHDHALLGEHLSRQLEAVYSARSKAPQFYVVLNVNVGNPIFLHELGYEKITFPDPGYQLLGLFRLWNMVQYWYPYRRVSEQNWPAVLHDAIPQFASASNKAAYTSALFLFIAKINDTHANLWNALDLRPPTGECRIPLEFRALQGKFVVTGSGSSKLPLPADIQVGDALEQMNGTPMADLVRTWFPFYAGSNEPARLYDIAQTLGTGACELTRLQFARENDLHSVEVKRVSIKELDPVRHTHDLPGPTFQFLSPEVAYLKLSSVKAAEIPHQLDTAAATKGLIIDIRNYPAEFVPFALGSHLVTSATPFVTFTAGETGNPGAFRWGMVMSITPAEPHYSGKVIILTDDSSMSQAEYTAMALRASPQAMVIGSKTAGADGNVSPIPLPGKLQTAFSGIGVFYPDRRPTQRVGIIPDIRVEETIAGIKAGRDQALERAIREILGPDTIEDRVRELARSPHPSQ